MVYANRVRRHPVMWPKCYRPKMARKWTILNRYILENIDFDEKWFMVFEHSINRFFWLCSFTPTWILFFFFFVFFHTVLIFFFLILFRLSTFKPLNALYSKFERLKISGRTSAGMKLVVPGWRNPPQWGPKKFWTLKPLKLDGSKFRSM